MAVFPLGFHIQASTFNFQFQFESKRKCTIYFINLLLFINQNHSSQIKKDTKKEIERDEMKRIGWFFFRMNGKHSHYY